jgi:hypothetical protein
MNETEKQTIIVALLSWLSMDNDVYTPHFDAACGKLDRDLSDHEILELCDKVRKL